MSTDSFSPRSPGHPADPRTFSRSVRPAKPRMTILIADDNPTNRKLLRAVLEAAGHRVFSATEGAEALGLLHSQRIDAIISDILMPGIDGYRLCFEVRESPKFSALPFIFYTGSYTSPTDDKKAMDLAADASIK